MDWLGNSGWMPFLWFGLGLLLLIFEVLGASGFLLGAAIAAIVLAVVTFAIDMSVSMQFALYAVVAVIGTIVYYRFFRSTQPSNKDELPERSATMVGRRFTLSETVHQGEEVRVQIGDTMWRVTSDTDIDKDTSVQVVDADKMRLVVAVPD